MKEMSRKSLLQAPIFSNEIPPISCRKSSSYYVEIMVIRLITMDLSMSLGVPGSAESTYGNAIDVDAMQATRDVYVTAWRSSLPSTSLISTFGVLALVFPACFLLPHFFAVLYFQTLFSRSALRLSKFLISRHNFFSRTYEFQL